MTSKVIMPQLGESVVEGTVTKWIKQEGEELEEFEALLEVNTDKVDTEVPAPAAGTLLKIYVDEGMTVRAGALLAVIGAPGDAIPTAVTEQTELAPLPVQTEKETSEPNLSPQAGTRELGFISPVVARMAAEHGIDLQWVEGSGRSGRITKKDLLNAIEYQGQALAPWDVPASGELFRPSEEIFGTAISATVSEDPASGLGVEGKLEQLDPVRKSIAEHMLRSKHTSPHVTTLMEADLTRVVAHRKENKARFAQEGVNLTYSVYFAAAAVSALKRTPYANASWREDGIFLHPKVNLGIAVSLGQQGLIVPVVQNADQLSLLGLAKQINDLALRARSKKLKPEEVRGGTFTITNHGTSGSLLATPIINQPQSAILGVGKIQKRVVAIESQLESGEIVDSIAVRPMVYLTLTFDHRILDGAVGDRFLGDLISRLEQWN
jgi:pyruvate/2-oxoglutarate dehydrogenase complex dihydrolipoamide acyltransferase (E2) component